jgi:methionyl-tRNA formyltransferase
MSALNIVFAGTPPFTLPSLNALHASKHSLRAVFTQPDRPAGRGRTLQASAVKHWAQIHNYPVYQPVNFKDDASIDSLRALAPDVLVVIAYGLILPQAVLDIPKLACINVHASLLPHWRGASPIQQAIAQGDTTTGVTIMQMDAGMDTGAMFTQTTCPIHADDTAETLHERLSNLATAPLMATLDALAIGFTPTTPQDHHLATYAPKIKKEDAKINWQQSATHLHQQIRAFYPWPIAYTHAGEEVLRIHQASIVTDAANAKPGSIVSIEKSGILVATEDKILKIERLQFAGGKPLPVSDWYNAKNLKLHTGLILK